MTSYVYAVTPAGPAELPEGTTGVGDPPRAVRLVREGELAAVVSECPAGTRPRRRDLFAHQRVLTTVSAAGPVLPLRFGSVCPDDDAVRDTLAEHADLFLEQLETVVGRAEYNVKAAHREEVVLRSLLAEDPRIRELNEATRKRRGAHRDRLLLGQLLAEGVHRRREQDATAVAEALAPHATRVHRGAEAADRFLNLSLLVAHDEAAAFLAAVEAQREGNPQLELRVTGPLPPYSFVRTPPAQHAEAAG
ncbi:GvpL/GvpF family gas vesicle protein [Streptomyces millisiae]|uniref:GvpL/GvpF family gas vesicle protein n=1 Tax=Streptomyces millisiae TaxID=3075542 RepID=A0ABU2LJR7_9ACTN|nr:GvpL/GvpF family gas vesicle protein [Streptomyces sp. DSM 44918]MDT0317830.1 GvpL/GvpF family gas vesicle protein [Streptomyces sp. DSM 44918]